MSENRCLFCKESAFNELLHIDKFPLFFGAVPKENIEKVQCFPLTIAMCEHCSLIQQINRVEEDVMQTVYTNEYYNCPSPLATGMGRRDIDKFYSFFKECGLPQGRVLEIACFDGYLLLKLQNDGWDVYGCDPSSMTQIALDNLGRDRIKNEFFDQSTYPPESFDVIIVRNLLEHLYDIHGFIRALSGCLKKGGRVFIDVPNVNALVNSGGFGTFFHQHISYFSLSTLSTIVNYYDLGIEHCYEGNPNIFLCASQGITRAREGDSPDNSSNVHIHKEKEIFLQKNREMKEMIRGIFTHSSYHSIALFGASALLTTIVNFLGKELVGRIHYIFDNDSLKNGKYIYGCDVPISAPSHIKESSFDVLLISTYFFSREIYEQLMRMGIDRNKIIVLMEE